MDGSKIINRNGIYVIRKIAAIKNHIWGLEKEKDSDIVKEGRSV